jgi:hypothetical protein
MFDSFAAEVSTKLHTAPEEYPQRFADSLPTHARTRRSGEAGSLRRAGARIRLTVAPLAARVVQAALLVHLSVNFSMITLHGGMLDYG